MLFCWIRAVHRSQRQRQTLLSRRSADGNGCVTLVVVARRCFVVQDTKAAVAAECNVCCCNAGGRDQGCCSEENFFHEFSLGLNSHAQTGESGKGMKGVCPHAPCLARSLQTLRAMSRSMVQLCHSFSPALPVGPPLPQTRFHRRIALIHMTLPTRPAWIDQCQTGKGCCNGRMTVCKSHYTSLWRAGGCGALRSLGRRPTARPAQYTNPNNPSNIETDPTIRSGRSSTARQRHDVSVNKYLWSASLEVLNFPAGAIG